MCGLPNSNDSFDHFYCASLIGALRTGQEAPRGAPQPLVPMMSPPSRVFKRRVFTKHTLCQGLFENFCLQTFIHLFLIHMRSCLQTPFTVYVELTDLGVFFLALVRHAHHQSGITHLTLVSKDETCSQYVLDTDSEGQIPTEQHVVL